jgi:hypothetical protein
MDKVKKSRSPILSIKDLIERDWNLKGLNWSNPIKGLIEKNQVWESIWIKL